MAIMEQAQTSYIRTKRRDFSIKITAGPDLPNIHTIKLTDTMDISSHQVQNNYLRMKHIIIILGGRLASETLPNVR